MNERINELRLEAGIGRLHEVPYMVAVNKEGEVIDSLEGLQKFAELIVRECAGVCDDLRDSTDYEFEKDMADNCAQAIMKRFGVKE